MQITKSSPLYVLRTSVERFAQFYRLHLDVIFHVYLGVNLEVASGRSAAVNTMTAGSLGVNRMPVMRVMWRPLADFVWQDKQRHTQ